MRAAQDAIRRKPLEASLLAAQASATALGLLRPIERTTVATTATATPIIAAAMIVLAARITVRRRPKIPLLTRGPGTVFRDVEAQFASADFPTVELFDGLSGVLFGSKPNECEPSRASAFAILWNVNVNDLTDLSEELA